MDFLFELLVRYNLDCVGFRSLYTLSFKVWVNINCMKTINTVINI